MLRYCYTTSILIIISSLNVQGWKGFPGHPCDRECTGSSMTCHYDLDIETYASMSKACYYCPFIPSDCEREHCVTADGFPRLIYTINRQLPSPQIRVCEGDILKVKVTNHMNNGEATTIHWHGLHQKNKIHMDGVSMITQCPILPLSEYIYEFEAAPHGTHWYHAHVGLQRGEGLAGALIVKPRSDPHRKLYDYDLPEHTLIMQDWFYNMAGGKGVLHLHAKDTNRPDSLIVNGRSPQPVKWPNWSSEPEEADAIIPYTRFNVTRGSRYRFRAISNVVMNCPIEFYIQDHTLLTIASDGADFVPVETDILVVSGGERWDFVLDANSEVGNYWIYMRGLTDCSQRKSQLLAVLHYTGADDDVPDSTPNTYDDRPTNVTTLNPFSMGIVDPQDSDNNILLTELRDIHPTPNWLRQKPDKRLYLHLGLHRTDNPLFNVPGIYDWASQLEIKGGSVLAQINRVHGKLPAWPYLTQYNDIPQANFCDVDSAEINETYCADNFCSCIHRSVIKLGDVVEIVMIDRGKYWNISNHPMHIHGQFLHIIAMGQSENFVISKQDVKTLDDKGEITRNYDRPISKDTVMMPDGGYIIGRFKADNPGPWFLHCHNELHVEQGMSMILQIGDPTSWPQDGSSHYKCGPYKPENNRFNSNNSGNIIVLSLYLFLSTGLIAIYNYL